MMIITYLSFTLLSILIQFTVMDFIQERMHNDGTPIDLNISSHTINYKDLKKSQKALYYKLEETLSNEMYSNLSTTKTSLMTTDYSSTKYEVLYEDYTSTETSITTDTIVTSTEFENDTETIIFNFSNHTTSTPKMIPTRSECDCDLMINVCDINCCCDIDCSDDLHKMFPQCLKGASNNENLHPFCLFTHTSTDQGRHTVNTVEELFCIAKTNLPHKRNVNKKFDIEMIEKATKNAFKWHHYETLPSIHEYSNKPYAYDDPVWLLKDGVFYYMDLPSKTVNNYCSGRSEVMFPKSEKVTCYVKLNDLEILKIFAATERTMVISPDELKANVSTWNCSTLHCTAWNITICEKNHCTDYNKSIHEPSCTDKVCKNLALRVDYELYYYESKIVRATIKLYTEKVLNIIPFMKQEVNVIFYLGNVTNDEIIKISGNPGYFFDLPLIVSREENNHSDNFFNRSNSQNFLHLIRNENQACLLFPAVNYVLFGGSLRTSCRLQHAVDLKVNGTYNCKLLQDSINNLFGIKKKIYVCPVGNPREIKDENWIKLPTEKISSDRTYGEYTKNNTVLQCFNIVTTLSFVFTFAEVSDDNKQGFKILAANIDDSYKNVSFNVEDVSTVLTMDYKFIDMAKAPVYEFANGPQLYIHLPRDFFFPFSSNVAYSFTCNVYTILLYLIVTI